jgi:hypothetical protein
MKTVYLVQYEHIEKDNIEDTKIVGIYSSEKLAREGIKKTKKLSGFRDAPEGFQITEYTLDKDN